MKQSAPSRTLVALTLGLVFLAGPTFVWGEQPAPVTKESSAVFRKVVKQVLPAVVSIRSKMDRPGGAENGSHPLAPEDYFDQRRLPEGFGSGVIISADGVVVTNHHVVAGARSVTVELNDGRSFIADRIHRDNKTDLAIVKLDLKDGETVPVARFGNSDEVEIGDWVLAMGAPFGLRGSVTAGIVSAKGRPLQLNLYEDFIQTDAAINPGNSGGPIVNLDGEIVGINAAIRSNSGSFEGIGFAIPSRMASQVVDALIKHGKVRRGYLGIAMDEITPRHLEILGINEPDKGILVTELTPGPTPARKAGLQSRDIIVAVNDQPVHAARQLQEMVTAAPPGSTLTMRVHRDGKKTDLPVRIEEQPEDFGPVVVRGPRLPGHPSEPLESEEDSPPLAEGDNRGEVITARHWGVILGTLTPRMAAMFRHPLDGPGVLVLSVAADGPAAKAGLVKGAVILEVEKSQVTTPTEVVDAITAAADEEGRSDGVLLKVRQPNGSTALLVMQP